MKTKILNSNTEPVQNLFLGIRSKNIIVSAQLKFLTHNKEIKPRMLITKNVLCSFKIIPANKTNA